ncbi:DUF7343 domain-containing protein [Halomicrococcus sp. SG-WS-1]|uniref:helix-turn-helix transcriptional regulator n=1 Tax=Halomicrococcus sp. SG-WS-1 TaxID=3439057 RepID=UPI003F7B278D
MQFYPGGRDSRSLSVVFAVLLVLTSVILVPPVAGDDERRTGRIVTIDSTGDAVVTSLDGTEYLWQSEPYTVNVTYQVDAPEKQYSVCVYPNETDSSALDCRSREVGNGSTVTVSLDAGNASTTGERTLYFELGPTFDKNAPALDNRTRSQYVMTKSGDLDGDGLTNEFEVEKMRTADWPPRAFDDSDMDNDGLDDQAEIEKHDTDPTDADSDDDGLRDATEIQIDTKPNNPDTDGDGIPDGKEYWELESDPKDANSPQTMGEGTTTTTTTTPGTASGDLSGAQIALLVLFGVGVLGATVLLWRASDARDSGMATDRSGPKPTDSPSESTGDAGVGSGGPSTPPESSVANAGPSEPLTDEGRVDDLLRRNGGRMKQSDMVEETGWSKSKVSRVLSRMEERGNINRLRVGRGNIVYLDGAKPSGVDRGDDENYR